MELVNIPTDLTNQAFQYYGISSYPPVDNSATWKLLYSSEGLNNSCMITNGENASIYMLSESRDYDNVKCNSTHFNNPNLQIIIMNANENFIFGQVGKNIYKLIPNNLLKTDDTQVESLSARIVLGEDKDAQFKERVEWYQNETSKLLDSANLTYLGIIQKYTNTGANKTYQYQVGKKRYFLGDTLTEWFGSEDDITDFYPFFLKVASEKEYIKHNGIVVMNPLGQILNENFNRQAEIDSLNDPLHTIMTRYNKRYIIHAEVYDGSEYFLISCISDSPFSINLKEALEVTNIVSISQPYGLTYEDISTYYNADTGLLTAWLPTCYYDSILKTERDFIYIGTYANAIKETKVIRSIPYTASVDKLNTQQTYIANFKALSSAGNNAEWGLVTLDSMLVSAIIPLRILYNGLSSQKMNYIGTSLNTKDTNSFGGIVMPNSMTSYLDNHTLQTSSYIIGQAHINMINFIADNTQEVTNILLFGYNKAFFTAEYVFSTSSRLFLLNDPNKLPATELSVDKEEVTLQINGEETINITTNAETFSATLQNSNLASLVTNSNNIVLTGLLEGQTILEIKATATNAKETSKNISVTIQAAANTTQENTNTAETTETQA